MRTVFSVLVAVVCLLPPLVARAADDATPDARTLLERGKQAHEVCVVRL